MPNYDSAGNPRVSIEGQKAQFGTVLDFNVGSGEQQICGIYGCSGGENSGGRILRVQRIELQLLCTSGWGYQDVILFSNTSGWTSGMYTIVSGANYDLTDIKNSGNVLFWSGFQASGSWGNAGTFNRRVLGITDCNDFANTPTNILFQLSGGAVVVPKPDVWEIPFTDAGVKQPTLRNAFQGIGIFFASGNLFGTSGTNASLVISGAVTRARARFVWTEESNLT